MSAVLIETRRWDISHQMLEALTAFDVVLVDGLSQLTRDASCVVEVLDRLAPEARVVLATAETSAGAVSGQETTAVVRTVMTAVAEATRVAEREVRLRRVKAGMAATRARQGERR